MSPKDYKIKQNGVAIWLSGTEAKSQHYKYLQALTNQLTTKTQVFHLI